MLARVTTVADVAHARLVEPHPGGHPPEVAIVLAHRRHRVERAPVDEAEVACVPRDVDLGQTAKQAVEELRGQQLRPRLADALVAHRVDDRVPLAPAPRELECHLGRILEVGVHRDDRAAGRVVEPRGQRELVAEVAGETDELDARVALVERAHQLEAPVGAAVVHEHHLGRPVEGLEHGNEAAVELLQRLALVEDRDHERVLGRRSLRRRYGRRAAHAASGSITRLTYRVSE